MLRAMEYGRRLAAGEKLPFKKLIYCNIGNPQSLGQQPITFHRQVCISTFVYLCMGWLSCGLTAWWLNGPVCWLSSLVRLNCRERLIWFALLPPYRCLNVSVYHFLLDRFAPAWRVFLYD